MKYTVTFTQHWSYEVEAKTTEEAENIAYEKFSADMHYPFEAVRTIKKYCKDTCLAHCSFDCPLRRWCGLMATAPETWPDPEEGGGEEF